jgi:hypothetical protein
MFKNVNTVDPVHLIVTRIYGPVNYGYMLELMILGQVYHRVISIV